MYPGIVAGEWMPAWLLAEKLQQYAQQRIADPSLRVCEPSHCEFRGGGPRPPEFRGVRTRATDKR